MPMRSPASLASMVLYQSERLSAYADRLIHAFTGKPVSFGGGRNGPEQNRENRRALCRYFGCNPDELVVPEQTHSANIGVNDKNHWPQTDAILLVQPNVPAIVQTADCVPVILYGPDRHVGAVIHAGWRGTAQSISAKTVARLQADYGCVPETLVAAIGPAVGGCCYEVSEEVALAVSATVDAPPEQFINTNGNGRPQIDLQTINRLQLEAAGVSQVDVLPGCTRCETDRLWSYRRGEAGRQVAFLCLK